MYELAFVTAVHVTAKDFRTPAVAATDGVAALLNTAAEIVNEPATYVIV